jgi:hypothetical protein
MDSWSIENIACASFKYLISHIPEKGVNPGRGNGKNITGISSLRAYIQYIRVASSMKLTAADNLIN